MSDDIKPWSIRGVPPESRNAAIAAANREKMSIGSWIDRAIRAQVQADRGRQTAPVVVSDTDRPTRQTTIDDVAKVVGLISEMSAAGAPPPKRVAAQAYGLLKAALSDIKASTSDKNGDVSDGKADLSDVKGDVSDTANS